VKKQRGMAGTDFIEGSIRTIRRTKQGNKNKGLLENSSKPFLL